jgi:hypothetical protein
MATVTKTATLQKPIVGQNIRDGKIEIQLMNVWQDASGHHYFSGTPTVVSSSLATRNGAPLQDTFIEAGNRDSSVTSLIVVLYLLTDTTRANHALAGDMIEVNVIAIGEPAPTLE